MYYSILAARDFNLKCNWGVIIFSGIRESFAELTLTREDDGWVSELNIYGEEPDLSMKNVQIERLFKTIETSQELDEEIRSQMKQACISLFI